MSSREDNFGGEAGGHHDEAIERAAIEWLCERDAGFAPGRAEAFAAWRAVDPRHEHAVAEAEATFALVEAEMPGAAAAIAARARAPEADSRVVRFPLRRALAWAGGLAAAGLLVAFWPAATVPTPPRAQQVVTEAGPPQIVPLEDGSILDVNANSRLEVQLTAGERRIVLASGEAHFVVAPDRARPFVVYAAGTRVRAVGTAFNVAIGPEGVEVVVVEGKVAVNRAQQSGADEAAAAPAPIVGAGQRAWLEAAATTAAPRVEAIDAEQIDRRLAWRKRVESFPDIALRELVERFNRVNVTRLVIEDASLAEYRLGGTFELDRVEAFVSMLERAGDIAAERRADHTIALRRAR